VTPYVCAERTEALVASFATFTFSESSDVDQYVDLLRSYVQHLRQTRETLWSQAMQGVIIPAQAVDGAIAAIKSSRSTIEAQVRPDEVKLQALSEASANNLGRHLERLLTHEVANEYAELLDSLEGEYRAGAPDRIGFGQYRGGGEYYRQMVRTWTTTDLEPDEIHRIGVEQVELIAQRLAELGAASEDSTPRSTPGPGRDAGQLAELYRAVVYSIETQIDTLFSHVPTAPWKVERLNPELEAGLTYGYYSPPTGATGAGVYYFNGSHIDDRTIVTAPSLMAHELLPGHHLQIATQLENGDLPAFRREPVLYLNAYIEGWAEYAADLGWELGLFDSLATARGRIENELFLAQRLVVDTGINAMGWTQEQALDYMVGTTSRSRDQLRSEVMRYGTDLPGQALAYRLGHLEFNRIRATAAASGGSGFDLRAFHDEVLRQGALPLPVLSAHIERWSASRTERTS
jgi:uncharacterized protein (DUF885 family)